MVLVGYRLERELLNELAFLYVPLELHTLPQHDALATQSVD